MSFNGHRRWICNVDDSPGVCRHIKKCSRADTAMAFLAFLVTVGLLIMAFVERRKIRKRKEQNPA